MSDSAELTEPVFVAKGPTAQEKPTKFLSRLLRKPLAVISLAWLIIIVALAVLAPAVSPYDPLEQDLLSIKQYPSGQHWLGTDAFGRDVLSRLLHGSGPTLTGVVQAILVATVIGLALGLTAGYYGGWLDRLVGQLTDLVMALPGLVILMSILAVFNRNMTAAMVTLGVLGSAGIARVIRSAVINVREELYIEAAKISGLGDNTIIVQHIVPRIIGPMIVQLSLFAATAVLTQTGISFLGLGVQPPAPTWGGMVYEAAVAVNDFPWLLVPPGVIIALTVLAFGLLGDAARDAAAEGWTRTRRRQRKVSAAAKAATRAATAKAGTAVTSPPAPDAFLTVRNLTIVAESAGEEGILVNNLSIDLDRGKTLGIVGESGSGKTLTSLAMMGLLPTGTRITAGTMVLDGQRYDLADVRSLRALRGDTIGMIFQEPSAALDPCFTIENHLVEVLRLHSKLSRAQAKVRAIALLEQVKIPNPREVVKRYPHQISGGMAQRVGIARTLAANPRVLLADEPTTALDVTVQADILDLIRDLSKAENMAVILVTHDFGVVADICDDALVLYHGDSLEYAPIRELFNKPQHPYTKALLRANPHNAVVGQPLPTIAGSLERLLEKVDESHVAYVNAELDHPVKETV